MKMLFRALMVLSLLWLTACESVFVEQPLGDEVVVLDQATWQGLWLNGELVITTTIIDAEKGVLQAAWIERGEHGAKLEMATGFVRKSGEQIYLNLPKHDGEQELAGEPTEPKQPEYHWARMDLDGNRATLWWPNQNGFRDAVKAGTLPGTIKEDEDVLLDELSPEQLQMINSPEANLMDWTKPMVFIRIAD